MSLSMLRGSWGNVIERRCQILLAFVFASLIAVVSTVPALGLEYDEVSWGFDGRAVPDQFNLLTVVVRNPSKQPFDGAVRLQQAQGFGSVGAVEVEPCFLAPGGSRMLQFYPRVSGNNNWRLSDGKDSEEVDPPAEGLPAIVQLVDGEDTLRRSAQFKLFSHQRFPTLVGVTEGLFAAIMDYSPKFAPAQMEAFLDWLKAGGRLHLFIDSDGQFPSIIDAHLAGSGDALLAAPGESRTHRLGSGLVTFHGRSIASLEEEDVAALVPDRLPLDASGYYASIDIPLFQQLQSLTRLDVAWPLVYLAAIIYIGLLGPGQYWWVKRKIRDYRFVLVVLLGTVALFSVIFAMIGRRGYGEQTQLSTVSLARHIEGSRYDVTSWGNLFVTKGADYEFRHPAPRNVYSVGETYESVNATVINGRDGVMRSEVPVFSSRTLVHRGTMQGIAPPELLSNTGSGADRRIEWKLPPEVKVWDAWVRIHDSILKTRIAYSEEKLIMNGVDVYFADEAAPSSVSNAGVPQLRPTGRKLFHRSMGMIEYEKPKWMPFLGDESIELYLLVEMPESFRVPDDTIPNQQGVTLYRYSYPVPKNP
ncbi:MAG: hypothetical protein ACI9R3_000218 [Verrucomicrobiales bacterium]|jgi:hypothetical protein